MMLIKPKVRQKVSDLNRQVSQAFSDNVLEDICNNSRKAAEALCKAVILNHYGESLGEDIILGKLNCYGGPGDNNELNLFSLSKIVVESNRRLVVITDKKTREKVKVYLETIRAHGNPASHDPNNSSDIIEPGHVNITKIALVNLLKWYFEDYMDEPIPDKLLGYINPYISTEQAVITNSSPTSPLEIFKNDLKEWFKALEYSFDKLDTEYNDYFNFIIKIPERRRTINVLIYGLVSEIKVNHVKEMEELIEYHECTEGWIVTNSKVSKAAKKSTESKNEKNVFCYNFDELIEETIDLSSYFEWIEKEIYTKEIDKRYIPLACEKVELHPKTKKYEARNIYNAEDGWLEGYIDFWQKDHQKEHISILGEFGTGKSWFCLKYTWEMIKQYQEAKSKNLPRPRIPILIFLREYSKALKVDTLISDFFFRLHKIEIKGVFPAFMQLNRMGKLLIIFDGFDEMADKINKQKMIDNFWELATVIEGKSKVIITCRNEHFPKIKDGRSLLNAELKESTKYLTGETPQFEVLELLKFDTEQIKTILSFFTDEKTILNLMENKEIVDLLSRPIMVELILDALKEIEKNKPIDMARVYLYATQRKMQRDITETRTFTSLADKLYFLCELSWEMLQHDKLKINYKELPKIVGRLFGHKIEDTEIDYWRYDLQGQTILIIDEEDGNYKPAHKSFLEFFVAYKFAAEMGVLPSDFLEVAQSQSNIDSNQMPKEYTWGNYFNATTDENGNLLNIALLKDFNREEISLLSQTVGKIPFSRAILDLILNIIPLKEKSIQVKLLSLLEECRGKTFEEVNYLANNIVLLLLANQPDFFAHKDLSNLSLRNFAFPRSRGSYRENEFGDFTKTLFDNSDLQNADFGRMSDNSKDQYKNTSFKNAKIKGLEFHNVQNDSIDINEKNENIVLGSHRELLLIDKNNFNVVKRIPDTAWNVRVSPDEGLIAHSKWGELSIRDSKNLEIVAQHTLSNQINPDASEPKNLWTTDFVFSNHSNLLYISCNNSFIYVYDILQKKEVKILQCFYGSDNLTLSPSEKFLVSSNFDEFILWDLEENKKVIYEKQESSDLQKYNALFHPFKDVFVLTDDKKIRIFDIDSGSFEKEMEFEDAHLISFSKDGEILCVASYKEIKIIDFNSFEVKKLFDLGDFLPKEDTDFDFHQLQEVKLDDKGNILYFITNDYLIAVDLLKDEVINSYYHFGDFQGSNFTNASGIDLETKEYLRKNGAIFNN
ncbi:restriction endonuclease [Bacillus cereus]|uniref:restriction endonuclease n=1 Tax=Bacillus cereus TaxID=1396 RepID=UPI000E6AC0B1|nr:restriction endonuclease [Bacillus cereus]